MQKALRIKHIFPEGLESHFVSALIVQHQPDNFILSFFEIWPPPILGTSDEEKKEAFKKLDRIDAKCVTRLVVTPTKMREFIALLKENMKNYELSFQDNIQEK